MEEEEGGRTFAEVEEDDAVASLRFSVCSTDSLQDVVSDLESARARELSLTLQNERLRSLVRQTSAERTPPISPKQNANCDVRILRVGQEKVPSKSGKLVLDVGLMTILPIKASFSVAEYVGYRVIDISGKWPSDAKPSVCVSYLTYVCVWVGVFLFDCLLQPNQQQKEACGRREEHCLTVGLVPVCRRATQETGTIVKERTSCGSCCGRKASAQAAFVE